MCSACILHEENEDNRQVHDLVLTCQDCESMFLFGAEEQKHFTRKNLLNAPTRCHNCRVLRRVKRDGNSKSISAIVCIGCKGLTYVPFKPNGQKPIYCVNCMYERRRIS